MASRAEVLAYFHTGAAEGLLTEFAKWLEGEGVLYRHPSETHEGFAADFLWGEDKV